MTKKQEPFSIASQVILPGEQKTIFLSTPGLFSQTSVRVPVHVMHGKLKGPKLFLIAAIHGDEINGVEIIRRIMKLKLIRKLSGTLMAVNIANIYGFASLSRYLPDRRDLNRSFPGSPKGSLASRLAYLYMEEIVQHCDMEIDLHTGSHERFNLPHIRANFSTTKSTKLAQVFGAPVMLDSKLRDGSLRQACNDLNIPLLLYEAGESLRFDETSIRVGTKGIINVMKHIGMLKPSKAHTAITTHSVRCQQSLWHRATESGLFYQRIKLGEHTKKGEVIGEIIDPFNQKKIPIKANCSGIVISINKLPLVNEGDALIHIATTGKAKPSKQLDIAAFNEPMLDINHFQSYR